LAIAYAVLSSLCFGMALITGRVGLRAMDARSGAAISIPTATLLFAIAAPFALHTGGFHVRAVVVFAVVGVFFPAVVTLLTFRSNELLGPTVTSAVSGTAPFFALLAAALFLGEHVPAQAAASAAGIVLGVALLSWKRNAVHKHFSGLALAWPIAGALVRGLAQAGAKAGLMLWPNPFAAGLIGYLISSATVVGTNRLRQPHSRRATRRGIPWFVVTGILNGSAVLLMYAALSIAPVWTVAPIVASYPLVTAILGPAALHDEKMTPQSVAGATITVAAIAYLVSARP
jgi:drug/metabolite transporter (DMT)-like permease